MSIYFPTVDTVESKLIPNPSMPLQENVKTNTIIFQADSGVEQRRQRGAPIRTWQCQYLVLTKNQYLTIRSFFITNLDVTPFLWTSPNDGIQYSVRFDGASFQGASFSHNTKTQLYTLQFNLIQVL